MKKIIMFLSLFLLISLTVNATLDDGMLRYYNLNDISTSTVVIDSKGLSNGVSTRNANLLTIIGKANNGYNFVPASLDYIRDNSPPDFSGRNPFTFSVWTYPMSVTDSAYVYYSPDSSVIIQMQQWTGNTIYFQRGATVSSAIMYYPTSKWTHWVMSYDGTTLKGYRNGVELYSVTDTVSLPSATKILQWGKRGVGSYFNGNMDGIGVWNRALSLTEITSLYNAGRGNDYPLLESSTMPQPLLFWGMNEGTGSTAFSDATGILSSGCTKVAIESWSDTGIVGKDIWINPIGRYFYCNNNLPNDIDDGTKSVTYSFWLKKPNTNVDGIFVRQGAVSYQMFTDYSNHLIAKRGTATINISGTSINTWTHYIMSYDGSHFVLRKNNIVVGNITTTESISTSAYMGMGNSVNYGGVYLDGYIDSVGIWKGIALSSEYTSLLYNNGVGREVPLVNTSSLSVGVTANYEFENNVRDNSVNARTLTWSGAVGSYYSSSDKKLGSSSGYFDVANNLQTTNTMGLAGSFSLNVWAKQNDTNEGNYIFRRRPTTGGDSNELRLYTYLGKLNGFIASTGGGTYKAFSGATTLSPNVWYMYTITWDNTGKVFDLYVNGVKDTPYTKDFDQATNMASESIMTTLHGWATTYDASLLKTDSMTLWLRKITDAEVMNLFNSGNGVAYPFETNYVAPLIEANQSVIVTPTLSTISLRTAKSQIITVNVTNYENNVADRIYDWTVNSTVGTLLKQGTNSSGASFNCVLYESCKNGASIYVVARMYNGTAYSSYSSARFTYIYNNTISMTPVLNEISPVSAYPNSILTTQVNNYVNNEADKEYYWTVNSTGGTILLQAFNTSGESFNCALYPSCKGGSTIYVRSRTYNETYSSYSTANTRLIINEYLTVDYSNSTYTPLNNTWHDGSVNFYFNPKSSSNLVICDFIINGIVNSTKTNITQNVQDMFTYSLGVTEQSQKTFSINCRAKKDDLITTMYYNTSRKTETFDAVNPVLNFYIPINGQRVYKNFVLNATAQNYLLNIYYLKMYNSSIQVFYDRLEDYNFYFKQFSKLFTQSNITNFGNYGLEMYSKDYAGLISNRSINFTIMNCTQLVENWSIIDITSCNVSDEKTVQYHDVNMCGTILDLGNITPNVPETILCNYCTSTWTQYQTDCSNSQYVKYYVYSNSCCVDTGFGSDCNKPANSTFSCTQNIVTGFGIASILGEMGRGIGEFSLGLISGKGLITLLLTLAIIIGVVAIMMSIIAVIKKGL